MFSPGGGGGGGGANIVLYRGRLGDCATSTRFGLAPRRLVEAALFKLRKIQVPQERAHRPSSGAEGAAGGAAAGPAASGLGLVPPLHGTLDAVNVSRSPYTPEMAHYFEKARTGKPPDFNNVRKKRVEAEKKARHAAAAAVAATHRRDLAAWPANGPADEPAMDSQQQDTAAPPARAETAAAAAAIAAASPSDSTVDGASNKNGAHHAVLTGEDHKRRSDFAAMHSSLFDWLSNPVLHAGEDYSARSWAKKPKVPPRENGTTGMPVPTGQNPPQRSEPKPKVN